MAWDSVGPIRVSVNPTLGVVPMPLQTSAPEVSAPLPALPPRQPDEYLHDRLDAILDEIEGLRADLYWRSLEGRCRRFWIWLTSLVRS